MTSSIERMVAAWATEVGTQAAALPTAKERDDFLSRQRRQLLDLLIKGGLADAVAAVLADSAAAGAARISVALLERAAGHPPGQA